uniref:Ubiquitin-conjugating enzyme E2 Z n=1 Tax=viral metagenome TaxID=1070528 RepID=A0A6C0E5Y4_9ZZZZ
MLQFKNRLFLDIKNYEMEKDNLNKEGIYINYSPENIRDISIMIVGPSDTPYQNGFYFFDMTIPTNYPLSPPEVRFTTSGDRIRFHPNFYVEGFVCLSILNTWGKEEWCPSLNIVSIAKTIQSVMNSNPITNEPDYENEVGHLSQNYIKIIRYYNFKTAICDVLENCPIRYTHFLPIIKKLFLEKYESYMENIKKYVEDHDKLIICQTYSLSVKINYTSLLERIEKLKSKLN